MISVFQFRFLALSPWRALFFHFRQTPLPRFPDIFSLATCKIRWTRLQVWISDLPLVQPLQPSNVTWLWRDLSISSGVHQIRLLVCHWSSALASALCIFVFGLGKSLFFSPPLGLWSMIATCPMLFECSRTMLLQYAASIKSYQCLTLCSVMRAKGVATWQSWTEALVMTTLTGKPQMWRSVLSTLSLSTKPTVLGIPRIAFERKAWAKTPRSFPGRPNPRGLSSTNSSMRDHTRVWIKRSSLGEKLTTSCCKTGIIVIRSIDTIIAIN